MPNTEYKTDAKGRQVPVDIIKPIDLEKDDLVTNLVDEAQRVQVLLTHFKRKAFGEIEAYMELCAEQYDTHIGGKKGNVTLVSFDGRFKVTRHMADRIEFDEKLQVAKELIDECVKRWSADASNEIRILIQDAFQTDKQGKINTERVLGLRRLEITDGTWKKAMQAISDSIQVHGSKAYVRFYERETAEDEWRQISLDMSSLPLRRGNDDAG